MKAAVLVAFVIFTAAVVITTVGGLRAVPAESRTAPPAAAPSAVASSSSPPTGGSGAASPSATPPASGSATVAAQPATGGYTLADVAKHAAPTDCWIAVENRVYDVTRYLGQHPGGAKTITPWCGKESTVAYETEDGAGTHSSRADRLLDGYLIGDLKR